MNAKAIAIVSLLLIGAVAAVKLTTAGVPDDGDPAKLPGETVTWKSVNLQEQLDRQLVAQRMVIPFQLTIPSDWQPADAQHQPSKGLIFKRPTRDDGFFPNVHLYWKAKDHRTVEEWCELQASKHRGGGARELSYGPANTAGMRGAVQVYERNDVKTEDGTIRTVTKDWFFGRDGGPKGILRGIATGPTFMHRYQAIFDEIQKRLRYKP